MGTEGGSEFSDDQIRAALRDFRLRAVILVLVGLCLIVAFFVVVSLPNGPPGEVANLFAAFALVVGPYGAGGGAWLLARSRTMRRILELERFRGRVVDHPRGNGAMLIREDAQGPQVLGGVPDNPLLVRKLPRGMGLDMLVADGPGRWAVISPPNELKLFLFQRHPRWLRWRTRRLAGLPMGTDA